MNHALSSRLAFTISVLIDGQGWEFRFMLLLTCPFPLAGMGWLLLRRGETRNEINQLNQSPGTKEVLSTEGFSNISLWYMVIFLLTELLTFLVVLQVSISYRLLPLLDRTQARLHFFIRKRCVLYETSALSWWGWFIGRVNPVARADPDWVTVEHIVVSLVAWVVILPIPSLRCSWGWSRPEPKEFSR